MTTEAQVLDAEVVEETHAPGSTDLVHAQQVQTTLLRTDDPLEVIERATKIADKLKDVLRRQGLTSRIGNKDHVNVEGWQTVGMMVGVTPKKEWVRPVAWPADEFLTDPLRKARDRGLVFGYESSFYAQTISGQVIGAAEATCKRTESKWLGSDDYAIESMAQTRATSKALASVLRWIVTLAGYSGTPAEEMPPPGQQVQRQPQQPQQPPQRERTAAPQTTAQPAQRSQRPVTAPQKGAINGRFGRAGLEADQVTAVIQWVTGKAILDRLSSQDASRLIDALGKEGDGAIQILEDIRLAAEAQDERATKIAERYLSGGGA